MKPNVYEQLKDDLSANEPSRRYEAAILIGNCEEMLATPRTRELLEMLYPLLQDPHNHVRYYAIEAIGRFMEKGSIHYLMRCMETVSEVECGPGEGITHAGLLKHIQRTIEVIRGQNEA